MSQRSFHGITHNWFAQLSAAIDADDTSVVLKDSGATNCPSVPFLLACDIEAIRVTQVQTDTPSSGLDTLTVERAQLGTAGASHMEDDYVQNMIFAANLTETQERLATCERLLSYLLGGGDGVLVTSEDRTCLQVIAQSSPDMSVRVNAGACIAGGQPASLSAYYDTDNIVAPTANPRIDVVEIGATAYGETEINIVTGVEGAVPAAPSVTSGYYKLAEIYCRVGMTSIKDTDDSTNGYITDSRRLL
jgi:hypothetical protein